MTDYPVNSSQLIVYLVFTILSIVVSIVLYVYFMECSDINKEDRDEFNSLIYNFINERDNLAPRR